MLDTSRILQKGPEYLRKQMEREREATGRSAAERLAATKPEYIRTQQPLTPESVTDPGSPERSEEAPNTPASATGEDSPQEVNVVKRNSSKKRPDSLLLYRHKGELQRGSPTRTGKKLTKRPEANDHPMLTEEGNGSEHDQQNVSGKLAAVVASNRVDADRKPTAVVTGERVDAAGKPIVVVAGDRVDTGRKPVVAVAGDRVDTGRKPTLAVAGGRVDIDRTPTLAVAGDRVDTGRKPTLVITGDRVDTGRKPTAAVAGDRVDTGRTPIAVVAGDRVDTGRKPIVAVASDRMGAARKTTVVVPGDQVDTSRKPIAAVPGDRVGAVRKPTAVVTCDPLDAASKQTTEVVEDVVWKPRAADPDEDSQPAAVKRIERSSRRNRVSRSHSDISSRYSRNFADFDTFFTYCGLDEEVIELVGRDNFCLHSEGTEEEFTGTRMVRSVSVVTSDDGFSQASSNRSDGLHEDELLDKKPGQGPSVIERNARIIKWLYSCRNATQSGKMLRDLD